MPHYAAFHLGLHCLLKYWLRCFCLQRFKDYFQNILLVLMFNSFLASCDFYCCKQFGPSSGPSESESWSGSKLFDTLIVFLAIYIYGYKSYIPLGKLHNYYVNGIA